MPTTLGGTDCLLMSRDPGITWRRYTGSPLEGGWCLLKHRLFFTRSLADLSRLHPKANCNWPFSSLPILNITKGNLKKAILFKMHCQHLKWEKKPVLIISGQTTAVTVVWSGTTYKGLMILCEKLSGFQISSSSCFLSLNLNALSHKIHRSNRENNTTLF